MASTKQKPTKEQIGEAVDTLAQWFPEDAASFKRHRSAIVDHVFNGINPSSGSELFSLKLQKSQVGAGPAESLSSLPGLTPCQEACGIVAVDVVFFVLGLVGLHVSNSERITRAILRELGPDTLRGLARAIRAFSEANGAKNKAKALFTLLGQIYKAGGFRAAFKVIKDEMTTWEWIKTGVIAVAQITAWFATDGVAFIAEVALNIMSAEQLIEDAAKAVKACYN